MKSPVLIRFEETRDKLLAEGFKLLPVEKGTKICYLKDWPTRGITEIGEARKLLKFKRHDFGALMGQGMFAFDIEGPVTPEAQELIVRLKAAPTRIAKTPSGGYHFIYRTPAGVYVPKRPEASFMPGVEVSGVGSFIVLPPQEGREWLDDRQPEMAPDWVLSMVSKTRPEGLDSPDKKVRTSIRARMAAMPDLPKGFRCGKRTQRWIDTILAAPEGQQHSTIYAIGAEIGRMDDHAHRDATAAAVIKALLAAPITSYNEADPWTKKQVERHLFNGMGEGETERFEDLDALLAMARLDGPSTSKRTPHITSVKSQERPTKQSRKELIQNRYTARSPH